MRRHKTEGGKSGSEDDRDNDGDQDRFFHNNTLMISASKPAKKSIISGTANRRKSAYFELPSITLRIPCKL
jgi:hypothetical protein